ncbi:(Lyso)-N-acylphosphatidylethanolamine lipase isoform X1 [Polyodon spathula]|uniref:(Lyso)-N-acylphosphatidylethanolamine lipase isoform X1 n=2 Tax=Polyodon spathula TaxID=7913 RepID=UPI001B7E1612|nr:(Lyso)-N-acylphosphatidylethanolamine lipase isoform X1 [Polyodon spathula]
MDEELEADAPGWLSSWVPSWRPTSMSLLKNTEAKILACIRNDLVSRFVSLPSQDKIWTLTVNPNQNQAASSKTSIGSTQTSHTSIHSMGRTPLVLVHGFGGGVGLWVHNLDALSQKRTVHAFDLLGFGRSSRPAFSTDPGQAENQLVHSIEEWRRAMGLESVILLGHSLGGYLAASYALAHPQRVRHLILVDPWGFPEHPPARPQTGESSGGEVKPSGPPLWVKGVASVLMYFNPLAVIRAAGPWGPGLVKRFRPDFKRKFEDLFEDNTMTDYIYHCNAQIPSGEIAFRAMSESFGWAKCPMLPRMPLLSQDTPMTVLYGSLSWVDSSTGERIRTLRPGSYVKNIIIEGASHHVYADQPDEFNRVIQEICDSVN